MNDEWRKEHPELHVRLEGDRQALVDALHAAGIRNFEIADYTPPGWANIAESAAAFDALVPGGGAAARIGLDLANRTMQLGGQSWLNKLASGLAGAPPARGDRKRRRITDELLREVARIYRENFKFAPTVAVAQTFDVKPRMAHEYVRRARERGFLPPTTQGRKAA